MSPAFHFVLLFSPVELFFFSLLCFRLVSVSLLLPTKSLSLFLLTRSLFLCFHSVSFVLFVPSLCCSIYPPATYQSGSVVTYWVSVLLFSGQLALGTSFPPSMMRLAQHAYKPGAVGLQCVHHVLSRVRPLCLGLSFLFQVFQRFAYKRLRRTTLVGGFCYACFTAACRGTWRSGNGK